MKKVETTCQICKNGTLTSKNIEVEKSGNPIGRFTADVCSECGGQIFNSTESARLEASIKKSGFWRQKK
ncbi:hypothetical protein HY995_00950 [Candidatus Micrarchaeota archaeon]|nr:hypothetical protein [Candidatus Micrarchaeota archaeon]MBI5176636.1 hypothetical protein [Candidatus Micrarchaeota archaeon]